MQRKCSGFPVFMLVYAGSWGFPGGFESFWGRQIFLGFLFARVRAQVAVDQVDDLVD